MKHKVKKQLIPILCASAILFSSCAIAPEHSTDTETGTETWTGTDTAAAANAPSESYTFGTEVPVDTDTKNGVYQLIFSASRYERKYNVVKMYRYSDFFSLDTEKESEDIRFDGNLFEVATNIGEDMDFDPAYVTVTTPALYSIFKEKIIPLAFEQSDKYAAYLRSQNFIRFLLTDKNGVETGYTVFRDGTVFKNENEICATVLDNDATLYLFAAYQVYLLKGSAAVRYLDEGSAVDRIIVVRDGNEILLDKDQTMEFCKLVSDDPDAENYTGRRTEWYSNYSYKKYIKFNCKAEDHGEKLMTFYVYTYRDGEIQNKYAEYTIYSDGRIVNTRTATIPQESFILSAGSSTYTADSLNADIAYVSRTSFDTNAIKEFVEGLD